MLRLARRSAREGPRIDPGRIIAGGRFLADVLGRVRQGASVEQAVEQTAATGAPTGGFSIAWLTDAARQLVAWTASPKGAP
jgi:hypothetical protein